MKYYFSKKKKKEKTLPLFDKVGIKIKKKPDLVARLRALPFAPPHGHTF